jgi:endonuclease YncB( thermonuclease family)
MKLNWRSFYKQYPRASVILFIISIVVYFVVFLLNVNDSNVPNQPQGADQVGLFLVSRVIDGDTIELENGQKVRYIGIDTPESTIEHDCYGKEASEKNKELVEGKKVRLESDISDRDKYGRLLRYVYVVDPEQPEGVEGQIFVNDYLVAEGYASVSTYPPDVKYQDKFKESEASARENNKGLWSQCQVKVEGTSDKFVDKDCKDFKTQAEAQEFFVSQGGPEKDPHNLDADGDGKVCTSLP